jgi:outer membrane lipoprotein carrier protein
MTIIQRFAVSLLTALAALLPAAVFGQAVQTPPAVAASKAVSAIADPELRAVLERFDGAQAGLTTLSARFTERKEIGLLKNAVLQKGRFYHTKPDKFLWEYTAPEPKSLLMNGKSLIAYYPVQKQAEEIQTRLSRRLIKYFGLGQAFAELSEYYNLSLDRDNSVPGTHLIVLKPRMKRLEKRLLEVRIWLDDKLNQVRQLEYREADGDRTLFAFEEIKVNAQIDPGLYEIKLPGDVHVSDSFSGFFAEKGR